MMRLIFKALVVVFLAMGIGNYVVYLNTGKLPLSDLKEKLSLESLSFSTKQFFEGTKKATTDAVGEHISGGGSSTATKIYKWTDENGVVHYGERPAGTGAQELSVDDSNLSIVPAAETDAARDLPKAHTTTVDEAKTPIEKARAAAEAMKAHTEAQSQY